MVGVHPLILRELEHDAVQREAGLHRNAERLADTGARLIDGIGKKVDRQARGCVRLLQA